MLRVKLKVVNTKIVYPKKSSLSINLSEAMNKNTILLILLFAINSTFGQPKTPAEYGLQHFIMNDSLLGTINFYVTNNGIVTKKPLLILLDGSGAFPINSYILKDDGTSQIFSSIPFEYEDFSNKYHVVLISKPSTPFIDSLSVNSFEEFTEKYKPSQDYNEKLSLEWRVNSASKVINFLIDKLQVDEKNIVAIGYSEGGQVVPKLALENKKITKIVSIVGGGLNQFYDFVTAERLKAQKGIISSDSAQIHIDSLQQQFDEIFANPKITTKFWKGHTYQRWASFCQDVPLENMLKLEIPILLIATGLDENSPITGIDYTAIEFLRQKKSNLTYKVYPNCDHWFNDRKIEANRLAEMMDFVINWVSE